MTQADRPARAGVSLEQVSARVLSGAEAESVDVERTPRLVESTEARLLLNTAWRWWLSGGASGGVVALVLRCRHGCLGMLDMSA